MLFVLIIVAYGLGLLLLESANGGAKFYLNLLLRRRARISVGSASRRIFVEPMRFVIAAALFGIPLPRMRESFVEAQMMMSEFNESVSHTFGISRISSPFTTLELFRKLILRRKVENADAILDQTTEVHNRLLFALSIALVLTCISLSAAWDASFHSGWGFTIRQIWESGLKGGWRSAFRLMCDSSFQWVLTGHLNKTLCCSLLLQDFFGSLCLRIIAARCWEIELILVSSLAAWRK